MTCKTDATYCGRKRSIRHATLVCLFCLHATGVAARGDLPRLLRVLPENTVACVCIWDAPELLERVGDTATMRMLRDPEVQPIVKDMQDSAAEAFRGIENELGLSIEELRAIPNGEACLAVVAPRRGYPILVALIEVEQQSENVRRLIEYVQSGLVDRGDVKSTEMVEKTELTIFDRAGDAAERQWVFFEFDGTICVTSNLRFARDWIPAWRNEDDGSTLADNRQFSMITDRCVRSGSEPPQLSYFVDPLQLLRSVGSKNMALQMGLRILGNLGLDGFHGLGGSLLLGGREFESLHHMHLLVDSPRTGVLEVFSPKSGDVSPESWAPNDITTYMALHWDIPTSYAAFAAAYDRLRGPNAWNEVVGNAFADRLGVDLQRDLLNALDGRITRVTWSNDPEHSRRVATMVGLKLKDANAFQRTFGNVVNGKARALFTRRAERGVSYYRYEPRLLRRDAPAETENAEGRYAAILGDYLLLSDSEPLIHRAIETKQLDTPPLGDEVDFKLNASKISRLPGGNKPSMISFLRPRSRCVRLTWC